MFKTKFILPVVRDVIAKSQEPGEIVTGMKYLRDKTRSVVIRATWGFFITICTMMTLYQIYERIHHYFQYPVAVDYEYSDKIDPKTVPTVTICSTDTAKFAELRLKYNIESHKGIMDRYCLMDAVRIVDHLNITADEWWSYLDMSSIISKIEYAKAGKQYPINSSDALTTHNLPFGACATVVVDGLDDADSISIFITKQNGSCMTSRLVLTSQKQGDIPYLPMMFSSPTGVQAFLHSLIKMYFFASTPVNPCSTDESYQKCYKQCLIKRYQAHKNMTCKYPFVPEEVAKPICNLGDHEATHTSFKAMNSVLMKTHPIHNCTCPKLCNYLGIQFYGSVIPIDPNLTILTAVKTYGFTKITEHRSYDAVALFCDIGGNLGLFLGFSALSLLDGLLVLSKNISTKRSFPNKRVKMMHYRVKRLHKKMTKQQSSNSEASTSFCQQLFPSDKAFAINLIRILAQVLCVICCGYLLCNRVEYYFTYPTTTIVKITHNESVTFPDAVFCGLSNELLDAMTQLAHFEAKFNDYCAVTLVDFLDHSSAEAVWNVTTISRNFHFIDTNIAEEYFSMPLIKEYNRTEIDLPDGKCMMFSAGKQVFYGTTSLLNVIGMFSEECAGMLTVYLALHHGEIDIRNKLLLKLATASGTALDIREIVRENIPQRPCVHENDYKNCAKKCFEDKLSASISCRCIPCRQKSITVLLICTASKMLGNFEQWLTPPWEFMGLARELKRLPYMTSSLPMCNNSKAGREAQDMYMKLSASLFPTKDCNCIISCTETILVAFVINEPYKGPDVTINSLMFMSNIFERYIDIRVYNVVKMLCDIGGILGIALGFSILSIMDIAFSVLGTCYAKLQMLRST